MRIIFISLFMLTLTACGQSESEKTSSPIAEKAPSSTIKPSSGKHSSCVLSYADKPCKLLSFEFLSQNLDGFPETAEQSETSSIQNCNYSWDSHGRFSTMTISGHEMQIPVQNQVAIQWIKKIKSDNPVETFKFQHRNLSDEEKERLAQSMKSALDKNAEEAHLSDHQKDLASSMGQSMLGGLHWQAIEGLASAAAWGGTGQSVSLKVLDHDTEFEVYVEISDIEATNRTVSIELAKQLIQSCH